MIIQHVSCSQDKYSSLSGSPWGLRSPVFWRPGRSCWSACSCTPPTSPRSPAPPTTSSSSTRRRKTCDSTCGKPGQLCSEQLSYKLTWQLRCRNHGSERHECNLQDQTVSCALSEKKRFLKIIFLGDQWNLGKRHFNTHTCIPVSSHC